MALTRYDAAILGSGQGGNPLAQALAAAGWRTALVERGPVGGSCVNVGCTPSKTMAASARLARRARRGPEFGVLTGPVTVDLARVVERKAEVVGRFQDAKRRQLLQAPLDLVRGEARFVGERRVEVRLEDEEPEVLEAEHVIIDTGSRPRPPPLAGLDRVPFLDSTTVMDLETLPDHLVVLGGGPVGVEFASMFAGFGSQVTLVERRARLLAGEDEDVSDALVQLMRRDGVEVILGAEPLDVTGAPDGSVELRLRWGDGERRVPASHLLVATGQVPNTEVLDLPAAGVDTDDGGAIRVDDQLRTTAPHVYAMGDVTGGPRTTHRAYDDHRVLRALLLEGRLVSRADRLVPFAVWSEPPLGRVGLTEREARAQGRDVRVFRMDLKRVARAVECGEEDGYLKALVDPVSQRILGAAILGMEGPEVAALFQVAMLGDLPASALRDGIFTHPTLSEALNLLFADL